MPLAGGLDIHRGQVTGFVRVMWAPVSRRSGFIEARRVGDVAEDVGSFPDDVWPPGGYSVFRQECRRENLVRVSWFGGVEGASCRVQRGFRVVP